MKTFAIQKTIICHRIDPIADELLLSKNLCNLDLMYDNVETVPVPPGWWNNDERLLNQKHRALEIARTESSHYTYLVIMNSLDMFYGFMKEPNRRFRYVSRFYNVGLSREIIYVDRRYEKSEDNA